MNKNFLLALIIAVEQAGLCNAQTTFINNYQDNYAKSFQQTSDGGYIMAGFCPDIPFLHYDMRIIKTDPLGDTLWTRSIGSVDHTEEAFEIVQTADGGYAVFGGTDTTYLSEWRHTLTRLDGNGNVLWIKYYGEVLGFGFAETGKQTFDGGFVLAGWMAQLQDVGKGYLVKTDNQGDTVFTKIFGGTDYTDFHSIEQTSDSGYIIAGQTNFDMTGHCDVLVIKTNQWGDTTWTRTYRVPGIVSTANCIHQTFAGDYIVTGTIGNAEAFLMRLNPFGDTIWTRSYGGNSNDEAISVCQTADSGFILAGSTWSFGLSNPKCYIIKTDSNGDTLWTRIPATNYEGTAFCVQQVQDSSYVLAGIFPTFGLMKTDKDGHTGCGEYQFGSNVGHVDFFQMPSAITLLASQGYSGNENIILNAPWEWIDRCNPEGIAANENHREIFSIFPNPSDGNFTFKASLDFHGRLEIFSMHGKMIFEKSISAANDFIINAAELVQGIYYARFYQEENVATMKLVINR